MNIPSVPLLASKHPLLSEYVKLIGGTVLLILLAALAFIATGSATDKVASWGVKGFAKYMISGLVLASFILLIGGILLHALEWPVLDILNRNVNKLTKTTDRLTSVFLGDNTGQPGVLVDIQDMVTTHRTHRNIGEIALVEREFDNLQTAFISHSGILNVTTNTLTLRIVGTMLGTYGQYGLGLASEISELFKKRVGHQRPPFQTAYFGAPGHLTGADEQAYQSITGLNCLYPFSARVTACKLLLAVCKTLNNDLHGEVGDTLRVNIRYIRVSDIFPAMQLWGDEFGMVLFSTGHQDRQAARALPVAVMLKKEVSVYGNSALPVKFSLANTLKRLDQHLKRDFRLDYPSDRMESWEVDTIHRTLRVRGFQALLEEATLRENILNDTRTAPKVQHIDDFNQFTRSGSAVPIANLESMMDKVGDILQTLTTPVTL